MKNGSSGIAFFEVFVYNKRETRRFYGYYARNGYFSSEAARCEAETASMRPYFWNSGKKYDGEEQANYLAAVIRAFSAEPWWGGLPYSHLQ